MPPQNLEQLFRDCVPTTFDSAQRWRDAGFKILPNSENKILVASHPLVEGYLFKKYSNRVDSNEQLNNYQRRIEGAQKLQAFVTEHHLRYIAVPEKWLYTYEVRQAPIHILIVERLKILSAEESKQAYSHIRKTVLRELCKVLFTFKGLDSVVKNLPFTKAGQIAFIDTEHWKRHFDRRELRLHIRSHLRRKRVKLAEEIFKELARAV
jgi:hypothetical protein